MQTRITHQAMPCHASAMWKCGERLCRIRAHIMEITRMSRRKMSHTNASVFAEERPHAEPATTSTSTATPYIHAIMDGTRSHSHSTEHE